MKAFYAEEQKRHDPKAFLSSGAPQPNPEKPERIERLLAGLETEPGNLPAPTVASGAEPAPGNQPPADAAESAEDPADAEPEPPRQAVARVGDIWLLGEHRLACGSIRQARLQVQLSIAVGVGHLFDQDRDLHRLSSPSFTASLYI